MYIGVVGEAFRKMTDSLATDDEDHPAITDEDSDGAEDLVELARTTSPAWLGDVKRVRTRLRDRVKHYHERIFGDVYKKFKKESGTMMKKYKNKDIHDHVGLEVRIYLG